MLFIFALKILLQKYKKVHHYHLLSINALVSP